MIESIFGILQMKSKVYFPSKGEYDNQNTQKILYKKNVCLIFELHILSQRLGSF